VLFCSWIIYIFVAFPLASILTARFIRDLIENTTFTKSNYIFKNIFLVAGLLLFVGVILILNIVFPANWFWYLLLIIALSIYLYVVTKYKNTKSAFLIFGVSAIVLINVFLTHYFYFELMKYQAGNVVGKYIQKHEIPNKDIWVYRVKDPLSVLHYYSQKVIRIERNQSYLPLKQHQYVLVEDSGKDELEKRGYTFEILIEDAYFKVSELTPTFLNHAVRNEATTPYYFCKVIKEGTYFPLN
jgi:hypothetical protein